jgi:CBS domain containing-hemolysin-like protein
MGLKQLCVVFITLFSCTAVLSTPTEDVEAIGGLILQSLASMFSFDTANQPFSVQQVSSRRFARVIV